uniref:Nuclease SbcCD subunit C-like n=1 Tax=Petromyzon marinus TaxID=7757 RepID=A0AAJ7XFI0_PETMA|nr:nuclease SbcCD subunit C-like [Petromyzon marinus]
MAVVRQRGGPGAGGAGGRVGTTTTTATTATAAGDVAKPTGGRVTWLLLLLGVVLGVVLGAHLYIAWARVGEARETAQRAADASVELARRVREVVNQLEPLRVSAEGTRRDLDEAAARLDAADGAASDSLASLERRLAVDIAAFARELGQEQLRREELRREVAAAASWRERVDAETSDVLRRLLAVEELGEKVAARDDGLRPRLEELSGGLESLRRTQQAGVERLERLESATGEGAAERRALAERLSSQVAAAAEERRERDAEASRELGALRAALDAAAQRWEEARGRAEAALDGARRDVDGLRRTAEDHEGRLGEVAEAVTALEERAAESGEGEAASERLGRLEGRLAGLEEARGREDGGGGAEVAAEVEELRAAVGDAVERVRAAEERWRAAAESAGAADRLRELVGDAVARSEERLVGELEARIAEAAAATSAARGEGRSPGDAGDAGDGGNGDDGDDDDEGEVEPAGVSLGSLREELRRVTEQLAAVQSAVLEGAGAGGAQ